jgi:hypothetical protein
LLATGLDLARSDALEWQDEGEQRGVVTWLFLSRKTN